MLDANIATLEANDGAGFAYFNKLVDSVERAVRKKREGRERTAELEHLAAIWAEAAARLTVYL